MYREYCVIRGLDFVGDSQTARRERDGANVTSALPRDNFIWDEKHIESEGTTDAP